MVAFEAALARIAGLRVHFEVAALDPVENVATIAEMLKDLERTAAALPAQVALMLIGRADGTGNLEKNLALSAARAQRLRDQLQRAGVALPILAEGRGPIDRTGKPIEGEDPESRSVTFEVVTGGRP